VLGPLRARALRIRQALLTGMREAVERVEHVEIARQ
jgi:hypothetical protein